jgi:hypothetical protein
MQESLVTGAAREIVPRPIDIILAAFTRTMPVNADTVVHGAQVRGSRRPRKRELADGRFVPVAERRVGERVWLYPAGSGAMTGCSA